MGKHPDALVGITGLPPGRVASPGVLCERIQPAQSGFCGEAVAIQGATRLSNRSHDSST